MQQKGSMYSWCVLGSKSAWSLWCLSRETEREREREEFIDNQMRLRVFRNDFWKEGLIACAYAAARALKGTHA